MKRLNLAFLLPALLLAGGLFPGCPPEDDPEPQPGVTQTQLLSTGERPIWAPDGEQVLVAQLDNGNPVINQYSLQSLLESSQAGVTIWEGAHNYDYAYSPDQQHIAFSTPGIEGGVIQYDMATGDTTLVLAGGRRPTWVSSGPSILAEGPEHALYRINLGAGETEQLWNEGQFPKGSPNGAQVAFLQATSSGEGFNLRVMDFTGAPPLDLIEETGTDPVWAPNGFQLYVSQIGAWGSYDIVTVDLRDYETVETVLPDATQPSLGEDYMLAYGLSDDLARGTYLYNLENSSVRTLKLDAERPAAHPTEDQALVELDGAVYLLRW